MQISVAKGLSRFFLLSLVALAAVISGQDDQNTRYQYCVARPDTTCFEPVNGTIDSVGRDVAALGGAFRFCLEIDTIGEGSSPIRVILLLDKSGSMCAQKNRDNIDCCTPGDGSKLCMDNDPTDQRIEAAHRFVDNLKAMSPGSEVGVVNYASTVKNVLNPLLLSSENNVSRIHRIIDSAACWSEPNRLGKVAKTAETNLGTAMQKGLELADFNYNNLDPDIARHLILLTDGAWDDVDSRSPELLIREYASSYRNRPVPVVHGVFLSNSELHIAHGYPPQGCSSEDEVNLEYLHTAATLTDGMYFSGATPQTVVANFATLLDNVTRAVPQRLVAVIVTNTTTGAVSSSTSITHIGTGAVWEAYINDLPLESGENRLVVTRKIISPRTVDTITATTAVTVIRSNAYREALDSDLFRIYCEPGAEDLTGPRINRAVLTPASIDGPYDTLLIEFSEPVDCAELKKGFAPDLVFTVSDARSVTRSEALRNSEFTEAGCSGDYVTSVTVAVRTQSINPGSDSIRLVRESVTDQAGNPPLIDKKGPVVWGNGNAIDIITVPTVPGQNLKIEQRIVSGLNLKTTSGNVVQVKSRRVLKFIAIDPVTKDSSFGSANVYDPVGNLVRKDLPVFKSESDQLVYYLIWDGMNRHGRRVGSGAYLIIFNFRCLDSTMVVRKQKTALRW